MDRRRFLKVTAAATGCLASTGAANFAAIPGCSSAVLPAVAPAFGDEICVFTKPFNDLSFDELAAKISALGFNGIEAPIRKGGHIEPAQAADQLPQLVEALKKHNLRISVMTSDVNDASDETSVSVLKAAAKEGIRFYRMKYFKYVEGRSILDQWADWKIQMKDLAELNRELGITAVYQNHAGRNNFGAAIWDLAEVLEGIRPEEVGVAYDIRHATVEGGQSWPIGFRRIQPHVKVVYAKDFQWQGSKVVNVPLGTGFVSSRFFDTLKQLEFDGPISLHEEYLDHRNPKLIPNHLKAMQSDLAVLKKWLS